MIPFGNSVVYYGGSLIPTITTKMKENQKIMASKTSGSRKLKKSSLPKFEADVYSKIPSDGLIVFAVHYLIEQKIEITLEDIVSVCFLLFPHKFGLKRYPKWPDSAPINRHWGDVRRKRYVTANDYLGYRLTSKGIRLVKKAAKVLGVTLPKPIAKVQPVQKEKVIAPAPIKKIRPIRAKKVSPAPTPVKQIEMPEIKALPVTQAKKKQAVQGKEATQLELIKKALPIRAKNVPSAPVKRTQTPEIKALPVQAVKLRPSIPTKSVKPIQVKETKVKSVILHPIKVEQAQPEKASSFAASHVTKEAKERAGKFTRMMERSDAYIHYKKHGHNSKISEFDFRSLLLCTMESSAETLARNVELFKGYAGIHNRQDLIVFLNFCENKFSYLLKLQNKLMRKAKR